MRVAPPHNTIPRQYREPLYARANIPELWIVDLARRLIDAHTAPTADTADTYAPTRTYTQADIATLAAAPHITIPLAGLLD